MDEDILMSDEIWATAVELGIVEAIPTLELPVEEGLGAYPAENPESIGQEGNFDLQLPDVLPGLPLPTLTAEELACFEEWIDFDAGMIPASPDHDFGIDTPPSHLLSDGLIDNLIDSLIDGDIPLVSDLDIADLDWLLLPFGEAEIGSLEEYSSAFPPFFPLTSAAVVDDGGDILNLHLDSDEQSSWFGAWDNNDVPSGKYQLQLSVEPQVNQTGYQPAWPAPIGNHLDASCQNEAELGGESIEPPTPASASFEDWLLRMAQISTDMWEMDVDWPIGGDVNAEETTPGTFPTGVPFAEIEEQSEQSAATAQNRASCVPAASNKVEAGSRRASSHRLTKWNRDRITALTSAADDNTQVDQPEMKYMTHLMDDCSVVVIGLGKRDETGRARFVFIVNGQEFEMYI